MLTKPKYLVNNNNVVSVGDLLRESATSMRLQNRFRKMNGICNDGQR